MEFSNGISRLLDHVGLRAQTYYTGPLCGLHDFSSTEGVGHLHVVRTGTLTARQKGLPTVAINEPSLLFYPRPLDHHLDVADRAVADVLCASVRYDAGLDNAITQSFPALIVIPFREAAGLESTLSLIFAEAGAANIGRQVMLDRLCDVLLIRIVRHAIEQNRVASGILVGLAHPRLGKLLVELLDAPEKEWLIETMAARTHLSRNAFARLFKDVTGATPAVFLAQIRIGLSQQLLRKGHSLTRVAEMIGYGSQPAFSRAFIREAGIAPSEWLRLQT